MAETDLSADQTFVTQWFETRFGGRLRSSPSRLTETEIAQLEEGLPAPLPPLFRAYLMARSVPEFALRVGEHEIRMPALPPRDPLREVRKQFTDWAPLVRAGYVPFAAYGDDYGPVCFDVDRRDGVGDCGVVWMDHEELFRLPGEPDALDRPALRPLARPLFRSFRELLEEAHLAGGKGES